MTLCDDSKEFLFLLPAWEKILPISNRTINFVFHDPNICVYVARATQVGFLGMTHYEVTVNIHNAINKFGKICMLSAITIECEG